MPNRIMRETITTSEAFAQLTAEEERMAHRLKVVADDFGRFDGRRAVIRARCFPMQLDAITEDDVARWMERLVAVGLLRSYQANGGSYVEFVEWDQGKRAKTSKYPENCEHVHADARTCEQMHADAPEKRETRSEKREARNESVAPLPRRTRLASDFTLTQVRRDYARSKGLLAPEPEFEKFVDYHRSKGSTMLDWDAAWRTWVANAVGRFAPRGGPAATNGRVGHGAAVPGPAETQRMLREKFG